MTFGTLYAHWPVAWSRLSAGKCGLLLLDRLVLIQSEFVQRLDFGPTCIIGTPRMKAWCPTSLHAGYSPCEAVYNYGHLFMYWGLRPGSSVHFPGTCLRAKFLGNSACGSFNKVFLPLALVHIATRISVGLCLGPTGCFCIPATSDACAAGLFRVVAVICMPGSILRALIVSYGYEPHAIVNYLLRTWSRPVIDFSSCDSILWSTSRTCTHPVLVSGYLDPIPAP